jgi:hypothetical protein
VFELAILFIVCFCFGKTGGYVLILKEKFKLIKGSLKKWHVKHEKNIEARLSKVKKRVEFLDSKGENDGFNEKEREEVKSLSSQMFSLPKVNNSIKW